MTAEAENMGHKKKTNSKQLKRCFLNLKRQHHETEYNNYFVFVTRNLHQKGLYKSFNLDK